jgi:hypothetical protein
MLTHCSSTHVCVCEDNIHVSRSNRLVPGKSVARLVPSAANPTQHPYWTLSAPRRCARTAAAGLLPVFHCPHSCYQALHEGEETCSVWRIAEEKQPGTHTIARLVPLFRKWRLTLISIAPQMSWKLWQPPGASDRHLRCQKTAIEV